MPTFLLLTRGVVYFTGFIMKRWWLPSYFRGTPLLRSACAGPAAIGGRCGYFLERFIHFLEILSHFLEILLFTPGLPCEFH